MAVENGERLKLGLSIYKLTPITDLRYHPLIVCFWNENYFKITIKSLHFKSAFKNQYGYYSWLVILVNKNSCFGLMTIQFSTANILKIAMEGTYNFPLLTPLCVSNTHTHTEVELICIGMVMAVFGVSE